jgi:hypothetical protein
MTKIMSGGLAVLLWLTSIVLGIVEIVTVRNALLALYAWVVTQSSVTPEQLRSTYGSAMFISQASVFVLALVMVGVAIGTGEYHAKHFGERRSWRLFGWVLGIELLLLLVTYPFA